MSDQQIIKDLERRLAKAEADNDKYLEIICSDESGSLKKALDQDKKIQSLQEQLKSLPPEDVAMNASAFEQCLIDEGIDLGEVDGEGTPENIFAEKLANYIHGRIAGIQDSIVASDGAIDDVVIMKAAQDVALGYAERGNLNTRETILCGSAAFDAAYAAAAILLEFNKGGMEHLISTIKDLLSEDNSEEFNQAIKRIVSLVRCRYEGWVLMWPFELHQAVEKLGIHEQVNTRPDIISKQLIDIVEEAQKLVDGAVNESA